MGPSRIKDLVDFNPRTALPRAADVPFIDMAALPISGRDIIEISRRPVGSGGARFQNGDTLLARITPCLENGKGAQVAGLDGDGVGQGSTEFIVMRAKDRRDRDFVYYLSRHPDFRAHAIQQMSGTSGRQRVAWQSISEFEICSLSIDTRHAIGQILSALDDKIELNRRMNETLEASARTLFRDWFVDFGPTRAKAEGRPAWLAPDLWSLFPDRLGDDGVPLGWELESLLDQAHWVNGAVYKNMHFVDRLYGLPVVKIAELKAGVGGQTKFTNTDLGARYRIDDGELLFSWSGNPDTSIDAFVWTGGAAWLNQHIFAVRENGKRTKAELFVLLKWLMPQFAEIARNKQTTGLGHVTKDEMKRLQVVVASQTVREAFAHCVAPIFSQILSIITESRTLTATRDALLPKLMSGELRVRDAEAQAA